MIKIRKLLALLLASVMVMAPAASAFAEEAAGEAETAAADEASGGGLIPWLYQLRRDSKANSPRSFI